MKQVIAVFDTDAVYASRLVQYLGQSKRLPFQMVYFTSEEAVLQFVMKQSLTVLIIHEQLLTESIQSIAVSYKIILTEDSSAKEGVEKESSCTMYKYRSAETIGNKVMEYIGTQRRLEGGQREPYESARIIGIYSLFHNEQVDAFALTLAQVLSRQESVFYLDLGSFSVLNHLLGRETQTDLSDAIYCMQQGNLKEKLSELIEIYGTMEYISPVRCPEDLRIIDVEDICTLLQQIVENRVCETVVIHLAEGLYAPLELLRICHMVYIPEQQDAFAKAKGEVFQRYLQTSGCVDLEEKCQQITLPILQEIINNGHIVEQLLWSEIGDYVRALVNGKLADRKAR